MRFITAILGVACYALATAQDLIARDDPNLMVGPNSDTYYALGSNDQKPAQAETEIVRPPRHGAVTLVQGGTDVHYRPDPGFTGIDTFTYG